MVFSRLQTALKALRQLGFIQVALYAMYRIGLQTGHFRLLTETHILQTKIDGGSLALDGLFSLPSRMLLAQTLGEDGRRNLVAEADEIVAGKIRLFGGEPVPLRLAGEWPKAHWTLFERGKIKLAGDIKFIWEPARFGWVFTLGRAYHLTQNETYAETFWKKFEEFTRSNPPNLGPHWMNGQEVAIRLMALVWASQVFEAAAASSAERRACLARSVAAHASRIPPTLGYARAQNNNHLLSEATALYTAARALPDHSQAWNWQRLGLKWLDWCFAHQIDETGEYIQRSTNYQRLMLQLILWTASFVEDESRFARDERLASAARWLAELTDPVSGQATNLGANDGAYIFPLANGGFRDYRPVVQAASLTFLGTGLFEAGVWDEMSLWLGRTDPGPRGEAGGILPEYPVLRSDNSWGLLRAADGNLRLAHADMLHVDLWWRGLNIALDPGTYLYNGEQPWDNPWPATRFHNTVTINTADQMTRAGRFLYLDWAKADWGYGADLNRGLQEVHASHTGYHQFGLWHRRTLTQTENRWEVQDDIFPLESKKVAPFDARLYWLLPDWEWEAEHMSLGLEIHLKSPHGWITLQMETGPQCSNDHARISISRAGELIYGQGQTDPLRGWFSPTYGRKVPALSLMFRVRSDREAGFQTKFILP